MERNELNDLIAEKSGSLCFLARLVDDFIYMSDSRDNAEEFLKRISKGFPRYGCTINASKTRTNFLLNGDTGVVTTRIPWCGLLFDTNKCEVSIDISRYIGKSIYFACELFILLPIFSLQFDK